ncbi:SMP-30/gluconolactonase/LRE family protein [Roseomonas sp. E05]|uniref:SMP-30/gluconolactonase/LRE family protein n=1 Tax=Roseomonas sp. E05 TaxID=3046310 RepID=UPI0024B94FEE|nr:SMP-30/gluconolactonase/LRE family protein [Roseomonas sp. E05]MDJ0391238.1 SMP-30/gluconolactonase/LRE family protein [Roseomonas sp. E05]
MFAAPPAVEARLFARLPDSLRITDRRSGWAFGKGRAPLHAFLEGPVFDRAGNLYVTDIPYGRILRVSPEGTFSLVAEYDGWPNGLALHPDGSLWIADHLRGILRLAPGASKPEPVVETVRREGLKGTNDLTFARNGDLYFTDQGQTGLQDPSGRVYRLSAATGRIDCLIDNVPSPNGLVLTKDESALLLAVTRANEIWRLPLHADGTTSKVAAFIRLSGGLAGPDGLALDDEGNLAIAHCGLGTVWLFSRLGEPLLRVRCPQGLSTTNVAYGGPEGRQIFITESDSGSILVAEMPRPGAVLYSHRTA